MQRLAFLDFVRAVAVVNMVLFHVCYDLQVVSGSFVDWQYLPWVVQWQQAGVLSFIFIAGMSLAVRADKIGKNSEPRVTGEYGLTKVEGRVAFLKHYKPLMQAFLLLFLGQCITWATVHFLPSEAIYYGVLTFLGSALLLSYVLEGRWQLLSRVKTTAGFVLSLLLFVLTYHVQLGYVGWGSWRYQLPEWLYQANYAFWGFPDDSFVSSDYVSFLPHIFMYWLGFYDYKLLRAKWSKLLAWSPCKVLEPIGRHSLAIYFLHQPLLLGIFWALGVIYLK